MVGQRIRQLRLRKNLSLSELAERAGVTKSYLSNLERDIQSNPSIHFLEKVAEALNVTVDHILHPEPTVRNVEIDDQWYELIREAMASGVSKEQFREFLEFNKWRLQKDTDSPEQ